MNEIKNSTSYGTSDRTDGILGVVSIVHTDIQPSMCPESKDYNVNV